MGGHVILVTLEKPLENVTKLHFQVYIFSLKIEPLPRLTS